MTPQEVNEKALKGHLLKPFHFLLAFCFQKEYKTAHFVCISIFNFSMGIESSRVKPC